MPNVIIPTLKIDQQRKRIGGNFAIAYAIHSLGVRNHIRTILPDCIFVTLTLSKESQRKRLLIRHDEKSEVEVIKFLTGLFDIYELPEENEKNIFNIEITDEMTPDDVVERVKQILNEHNQKDKEERKEEIGNEHNLNSEPLTNHSNTQDN